METLLIFVPCALFNEEPGYLCGVVQETKEECVKSYFVFGKTDRLNRNYAEEHCKIIGYYCGECSPSISLSKKSDWVLLGLCECEFILREILSCGNVVDTCKPCRIVCIVYDHQKFIESEFLYQSLQHNGTMYGDHFIMLASKLHSEVLFSASCAHTLSSLKVLVSQHIIKFLLCLVNIFLSCITAMRPVLKYTTLGSHLEIFLQSLIWILQSCCCMKNLSVKVRNYVVAIIVDVCSGMLLLYWLTVVTSSPSQLLLESGEVVVRTLQELLQWLMGIPAGLKLNYAFNNILGQFFLYHINLWWTFLVVTKPLLEVMFHIFLCLGRLGLTFQTSILADLLALVSFHVYCIYVYAARLYSLQVSGLVALWRLFLGRKHNPLRERVDSCQYSPGQLFVGTLAFTILLFLLPTTFMYYIVFAVFRLVVVCLGGVLTRVRYVLQCLPLYVSVLWMMQSPVISSTVHLTVCSRERQGPLLLSVKPVCGSWWRTVQYCMPEPVQPPPRVKWRNLVGNLVSGRLIYPV